MVDQLRFNVCIPDFDETSWHEVDESDDPAPATVAARYAETACTRDNELYSSFDGDGLIVLVRAHGRGKVVAFTVSCEMVPTFTARSPR
jgi:hypothetical protein